MCTTSPPTPPFSTKLEWGIILYIIAVYCNIIALMCFIRKGGVGGAGGACVKLCKKLFLYPSTVFNARLVFEMLIDFHVCLTIVTKEFIPKLDNFDCGFLKGVRIGNDQLSDVVASADAACCYDVAHYCSSCGSALFLHHEVKA